MIELTSRQSTWSTPVSAPTSDYRRVIDGIKADIAAKRLKPGDALPTTAKLAEQYEVSESTVKNAVRLLRETGVLRGHPGKAVYVV